MSGKFPAVGPHQNFAANLLALCNRHGTIASVCRLLGINRQQFNKYLAGTNLPGPAILDRISQFFGVPPETLFAAPTDGPLAAKLTPDMAPEAERYLDLIPAAFRQRVAVAFAEQREAGLREGCYALFFPFTRDPTHCVRAAVSVYRRNGLTLFSRITRMRLPGRRRRYAPQQRHDGVVIAAPASLQFVANDRHGFRDISLARFEAPAQSSRGLLNGLAMGLGTESPPMSMRVALEYLGSAGLERQMLERSGLLPIDSPDVPEQFRLAVRLAPGGVPYLSAFDPAESLTSP